MLDLNRETCLFFSHLVQACCEKDKCKNIYRIYLAPLFLNAPCSFGIIHIMCVKWRYLLKNNIRCLPPAAPLPTSPAQILRSRPRFHRLSLACSAPHSSNWSSTTCSDGVWLLLCSLGRNCPCTGSLPGCCGCLPAGGHIACLLSRKVWHSTTLLIAFSLWLNAWPLRMVATEKREWYELSDHWQGRRMVTNSLQLDAHLSNKCFSSNCFSDGEHEISAWGIQSSKLVGHHKLFLLYTVTHPCFCSFSALPGTHSGYFDNSIANQIKNSSHQVYHWI